MAAKIDRACLKADPSRTVWASEYDKHAHGTPLCPDRRCRCVLEGVQTSTRNVNGTQVNVDAFFRLPNTVRKLAHPLYSSAMRGRGRLRVRALPDSLHEGSRIGREVAEGKIPARLRDPADNRSERTFQGRRLAIRRSSDDDCTPLAGVSIFPNVEPMIATRLPARSTSHFPITQPTGRKSLSSARLARNSRREKQEARACPQLSQMTAAARWIAAKKLTARLS